MSAEARLGLLGLDSSHAPAFVRLLNGDDAQPPVLAGARVVAACPGPRSDDFAPSPTRMAAVVDELA